MARFTVHRQLAGFSGSVRWVQSYKSLHAAKRRADAETGYGVVGTVSDQQGQIIYRGSANYGSAS